MSDGRKIMWLWLILLNLVLVSLGLSYAVQLWRREPVIPVRPSALPSPTASKTVSSTTTPQPAATATPFSIVTPPEEPLEVQGVAAPVATPPPGLKLIIPVAGVKPEQLRDTFAAARGEGRTHNAIDIMAPASTPVLAAAAGKIARLFVSERGGITLYQLSEDEKVVFYYAHLERYADGMVVGRAVRQGEEIAYVGDTGNAGAGNYHLHFAVWLIEEPKRFWHGLNLNPYLLLKEKR